MLIPTLILLVLAVGLVLLGYLRGEGQHVQGLQSALRMTLTLLPLLICAMIVAGMVQVLLPREPLARWIGAESGVRGILLGTVAGALSPGGPYVSLPIVAGLLQAGAPLLLRYLVRERDEDLFRPLGGWIHDDPRIAPVSKVLCVIRARIVQKKHEANRTGQNANHPHPFAVQPTPACPTRVLSKTLIRV